MQLITVTDVVHHQLDKLCIREFPCGPGEWRNELKWESDLLDPLIQITDKACYYSMESLKELCFSLPFQKDVSWSKEVVDLQKLSIDAPNNIYSNFVYNFFRSLRLVSKEISEVDCGLLKFENLSELCLSANQIDVVKSHFLPRSLKVLEMFGNRISDLSLLCVNPPKLEHVGLGHNLMTSLHDFSDSPNSWSTLLSLDLSNNDLCDIQSSVECLKGLPKLRNLLLQGNPLRFFLGYRGFVVDSLKSLSFLDDTRISAEEKHKFKGLSKLKDLPTTHYSIEIKLPLLNGVCKPADFDSEPVDVFPRTDIFFHIEFNAIQDLKEEVDADEEGQVADGAQIDTARNSVAGDTNLEGSQANSARSIPVEETYPHSVKVLRTNPLKWVETGLAFQYHKRFTGENLDALKMFIGEGIDMRLVQSKVLVTNEPPEESMDASNRDLKSAMKGGKRDGGGGGGRKSIFQNKAPPPGKGDDSKAGKGKAKGKAAEEVFELSREEVTIATVHVDCNDLMEGTANVLERNLLFERVAPPNYVDPSIDSVAPSVVSETPNVQTLNAPGADTNRTSAKPPKSALRGGTAAGKKAKAAEKAAKEAEVLEVVEELPPQPITMQYTCHVTAWKTAKEAHDATLAFVAKQPSS